MNSATSIKCRKETVNRKLCSRSHSRTVVLLIIRFRTLVARQEHTQRVILETTLPLGCLQTSLLFFLIFFCTLSCVLSSHSIKRIWWWQNNPRLYSVVYSPTFYTSSGVGSSAVRNSLNFALHGDTECKHI